MNEKIGFLCCQGWEEVLCWELNQLDASAAPVQYYPGFVMCQQTARTEASDLIFARQWLPRLQKIAQPSAKTLVKEVGYLIDEVLDHSSLPWTFQVLTPDAVMLEGESYKTLYSRRNLLEHLIGERMQQYRRRAMERFVARKEVAALPSFVVVQGVLVNEQEMWCSIVQTSRLPGGRLVPSVWNIREEPVPLDLEAPCRSYYKIEEAWLATGIAPQSGELCIDIGAAPGGWTWAALKRGARVIAVDDAEMAPVVSKHPRLEHRRENGYAFMPEKPADWMFCDMIARPLATLGLLERWLEQRACRHFVVNIKFRGKQPGTVVSAANELLAKHNVSQRLVRHLFYDRNEITLAGTLA